MRIKKAVLLMVVAVGLLSMLLPVSVVASEPEKTVRVGWFPYPRSSEVINGEYTGYTYDYLVEIAKYTGWKYEFVHADFATCAEMLKNGEVDIIGGLQKSSEREKVFDFPDIPYGETYSVLYTDNDSTFQPYDFENYDGIKVGVLKGTLNNEYITKFAQDNGFSCYIEFYESSDAMNEALSTGEIDAAVLTNDVSAVDSRILAKFAPNSIYIVTTKGNNEVLSGLNRALSSIKINRQNFMAELFEKYYTNTESLELTEKEQEIVKASKDTPLIVGVIENSAPVSFLNQDTGTYEGIAIDMLDAVSEKTGLCVSYIPIDFSSQDDIIVQNKPMIVLGVAKAENFPETQERYFSDSVLSDSLAVVGIQGRNLSDEHGDKTVAVMSGLVMASEYAKQYMPEFQIVEYPTPQACFDAVAEGKADATVYFHSCISYIIQKPCYERLEIIPTYSESIDVCVASYDDKEETIISIINKGLKLISEDERRNIVLNSTVGNPYKLTLTDTLYKYRSPMIIIVCLVVFVVALLTALYLIKRKSGMQVKEALAQAKQAGDAKGNFMSRMSHEIRTPLNAVIGYNTIARNEISQAKTDAERRQSEMKVMDCLTKSDIASRHLLTIINDVLDISAIESGKIKVVKERFDFKGLISSITAIFYSQAKSKGVDFDVQFDKQMDEWIIGDQVRVNQILTNLLSNAIKFTNEGGNVTLYIHPQTEQDTVKLHFEVRDSGIGMSEDYMKRIWMPFEQADSSISRRFGGTGLGLSITKTLVDLLGGNISFKSREGEGSTFYVELTMERTEQPQEHGPYDFSQIKALIVDDDVSTCDYIRLLLTRSGVRSAAVYTGAEAVNAVKSALDDNSPYTVCLIDWRMPKMDGLETVRQIRMIAGNELPIIVITAYDFSEVEEKASEVGVNSFISKPLFQSSLFNLLANISGSPVPRDEEKLHTFDFSGARVLLAEDNAMNMEIARKILESANLTVDSARNGQEAVNMFLASQPGTYNAILMDVQMPVMDGYQATRTIRASQHSEASTIHIIAMTADAFSENIAESMSVGMNAHISKPIDLPTLFRTLKKIIIKTE